MKKKTNIIALFLFFLFLASFSYSQQKGVEVKPSRSGPSGDVVITVDGKPFTSFISKIRVLDIGKPIFWPIYSAKGTIVNRGWPLVTDILNEQNDHPHHTGLFFTYGVVTAGDIKNLNFWAGRDRGERIRPIEIKDYKSGKEYGLLETVSLWESPETGPILEQTQKNIFRYDQNSRIIDFDIILKTLKIPVIFEDTKEGSIGLRVHHNLTEGIKRKGYIDAEVKKAESKILGNGEYVNAEGLRREANVWGKRSKWVALSGKIGDEPIVIAIMFKPDSHNFPPFWHARGYGLFTANPFGGRAMYSEGKEPPLTTTMNPGDSIEVKYRFLVYSGELTKEQIEMQYNKYLQQSASLE